MREQIDGKGGVNTASQACSSVASASKAIFREILVDPLHANICFEFLVAWVKGQDVAAI